MIAGRIKEARLKKRYTQKDLARILNVKPTTISGWELGRNEPSIDVIKLIAKKLNVSFDYLVGVDNSHTGNDLNTMLDGAESYDGKPITKRDKELIKQYLEALYSTR